MLMNSFSFEESSCGLLSGDVTAVGVERFGVTGLVEGLEDSGVLSFREGVAEAIVSCSKEVCSSERGCEIYLEKAS